MPTPTKGPRFGGSPAHERIILGNLASQLFEHGRIVTTEAKAKRLRPLAEKLITKAKRGDLHSRRQVMRVIRENDDKSIVHLLFTEIAPSFADRDGGYLRITKVGPRKGDNAPMAVIELVTETVEDGRSARAGVAKKAAKKAPAKKTAKAADTKPAADQATVEATPDPETNSAETKDSADEAVAEGSYRGATPPDGYDIKGNEDSMKYHTPESPWYERTIAEVWFNSAAAAEKAGFVAAAHTDADDAKDE